jgi:hypothetical protein
VTEDLLLDALRESYRDLHMTVPVEDIMSRGRSVRRRRRIPLLAAAAVVTGVAATTATGVFAGNRVSGSAWAVSAEANNTVTVSISQLRDPNGLEHALAAHGVRAVVQFNGSGCSNRQPYQAIPDNAQRMRGVVERLRNSPDGMAFAVHPDAIPDGTQLDIALYYAPGHGTTPSGQALRLVPLDHPTCAVQPPAPSSAPR